MVSIVRVKAAIAGAAVAVVIAVLVSMQPNTGSAAMEDAATTFKTNCASCHGMDGSGATAAGKKLKVRDLRSAEVQKQADNKLTEIIAKGKNKMPGYGSKMSKDEIGQLVAHIRAMAKKGS